MQKLMSKSLLGVFIVPNFEDSILEFEIKRNQKWKSNFVKYVNIQWEYSKT